MGLDSILVDETFINKIDMAVKQSKSSCCNMVKFLDILSPHLSVSTSKQLFSLFKQVFWLLIAAHVFNFFR